MSSRNPYKESHIIDSLVPASRTADADGESVDTRGWLWMRVKLHLGTISGDETIVLSLEQSSDDGDNDAFAAVPTYALPETGTYAAADSGAAGDKPKELMLFLPTAELERYVRPTITTTGTGAAVYGVEVELLNPVTSALATQDPEVLVAS